MLILKVLLVFVGGAVILYGIFYAITWPYFALVEIKEDIKEIKAMLETETPEEKKEG